MFIARQNHWKEHPNPPKVHHFAVYFAQLR